MTGTTAAGTLRRFVLSRGRNLLVIGLIALALITPWSLEIAVAHAPEIRGWANPAAAAFAIANVAALARPPLRWRGPALAVAAASLVAWLVFVSARLALPDFRNLRYTFLPMDVLGEGWYLGLIAWLLSMDAVAAESAYEDEELGRREYLLLSLVPGLALVRLGRTAAGRAWLGTAAVVAFLIQISATRQEEFSYYAVTAHSVPPDEPRRYSLVAAAVLLLVWVASLVAAWRARPDR